MKEGKPPAGWDDIMSLPRCYWLADGGTLGMSVAGDVESLRHDHRQVEPMDIPANEEVVLDGIGGKAMEIQATIEPGDAREVGLYVLRSPDARGADAHIAVPAGQSPLRHKLIADRRRGGVAQTLTCSRARRRQVQSGWRRTNHCGFGYSSTAASWRCSPTTANASPCASIRSARTAAACRCLLAATVRGWHRSTSGRCGVSGTRHAASLNHSIILLPAPILILNVFML